MKTCVFFNTLLAKKKFITPDNFDSFDQTADDLEELSEKGGDYRFVVSSSNHGSAKKNSFIGKHFEKYFTEEGWRVGGSFRQITDSTELTSWLPCGVGNAVHIVEGELGLGGKYTLTGPGAGPEPNDLSNAS